MREPRKAGFQNNNDANKIDFKDKKINKCSLTFRQTIFHSVTFVLNQMFDLRCKKPKQTNPERKKSPSSLSSLLQGSSSSLKYDALRKSMERRYKLNSSRLDYRVTDGLF